MDPVTSASTASQALSPTFTFKFYLSKECKVSLCVKEAFDELNNFYTSHSNTMPNATQFAEVLSKKGVTTMDDEAMVRTLLITHLATDIVLARNDKDIVWQLRFWLEQLNDHPSSTLVEKVTGFIVEYHGWLTLSFLGNFHHFHDYDTFKFVIEFLMKTKPGSKILQEAILLGGEHFAAPNASLFLKLKEVME